MGKRHHEDPLLDVIIKMAFDPFRNNSSLGEGLFDLPYSIEESHGELEVIINNPIGFNKHYLITVREED